MKISFIGSGNVATHLALAMYGRGSVIEQIYSPNPKHAKLLADRVNAETVNHLDELQKTSDVYILAIKDDALFDVATELRVDNRLVLHTSGATPIDVLKRTSSHYGVIWSPQTFLRDEALEYSALPFCIEGNNPETERQIEELVGKVSEHIYHTDIKQRQYLHLCAVFVNNFSNGMVGLAQKLGRDKGLPFEVLNPLIATTAKRMQYGDVRYLLTGPAVRNDIKTIKLHRMLLENEPDMLRIYDDFTRVLQQLKKSLKNAHD